MAFVDRLSLRGKLLLIIVGTSLLALAIVGTTFLVYSWSQSREVLGNQLTTVAQLLADRSSAALAFVDDRTARENLQSLRGVPHVSTACLYDADGVLFADYRHDKAESECPAKAQILPVPVWFVGGRVITEALVGGQGRELGRLQVTSTMAPVDRLLGAQLVFGGIGLLLAAMLSFVLAYRLQRLISRPVIDIRETARRIEQSGDFALRAGQSGVDEIGQLAQAFNRMLATIQSQNAVLTASQAEIAERVRRVELQQAAIAELTTQSGVMRGDLAAIVRWVVERAAAVLDVEAAGVWMFEAGNALDCRGRFRRSAGGVIAAGDLRAEECGLDPELLNHGRYLEVTDVHSDSRTAAGLQDHFQPHGIVSLLAVGIQSGARQHGLLCFEHAGEPRHWQADEIAFATVLSDQISITVQNALRVTSESALRESEAYNKLLFAESRIPLVVLDPRTGLFVDCNRAAVDIYGLASREAVLGRSPLDVSTPTQYDGRDSVEAARERIERALDEGNVVFEWRHQRPDGEVWDAEVNLMAFHIKERQLMQFSLQDITARKRAEAEIRLLNDELEQRVVQRTQQLADTNNQLHDTLHQLQHAQAELVRSEKLASLGALVAGVAHELNTPLGNAFTVSTSLSHVAQEFADRVARGELRRSTLNQFTEQVIEASDLMSRNLSRASDMIAHFKQVAVDQTSAQRRQFDLLECVDEIMLTLIPQFKHTVHTTEVAVPPGLGLESYPGPLGQVVTNIVLNSLIHGFDDGRRGLVHIAADAQGHDRIRLIISDNGVGIAPEIIGKVFDPFFTTKLGRGGSGLGLHIAYSLVTRVLGGSIDVASKPGEGTRFTLIVPRRAPYPEP